jgi:hypothetical protein
VFQSFLIAVSSHLAMGWKKVKELLPGKNRRAGCGWAGGKIRVGD